MCSRPSLASASPPPSSSVAALPHPDPLPCSGDWQLHHSVRRRCGWLRGWHVPGRGRGCWQGRIRHQCGLRHRQGRARLWGHLHPEEDHHGQDVKPEVLAAQQCKLGPLQFPLCSTHPTLLPSPPTSVGAGTAPGPQVRCICMPDSLPVTCILGRFKSTHIFSLLLQCDGRGS